MLATASGGMGGKPFEDFVACWLLLRLLLAEEQDGGGALTLRHLLLNPLRHNHPSLGDRLPLGLMDAELSVPSAVRIFRTEDHLAGYLNNNTQSQAAGGYALQSNVVYTFGSSNPGFDSLVLLEAKNHGRVAVAFEPRFSTVDHEVTLWKQQMQLLTDKCGVPPERCLLVYMALRNVQLGDNERSADDHRRQHEMSRVLILDRASTAGLLTPSLADRAFFTHDLRVQPKEAA